MRGVVLVLQTDNTFWGEGMYLAFVWTLCGGFHVRHGWPLVGFMPIA